LSQIKGIALLLDILRRAQQWRARQLVLIAIYDKGSCRYIGIAPNIYIKLLVIRSGRHLKVHYSQA